MKEPSNPQNEVERLAALTALNQLDTPQEHRFDRYVELAKLIFDVPIALVSLIDNDRQWFKARVGLDAESTSRSISFCGHAIHSPEVLAVEDTLQDERFYDNPLVTGPPFMRFYAGAPLAINQDIRVGTLCIIDTRDRKFSTVDKEILKRLAAAVRDELLRPAAPTESELDTQDDINTSSWTDKIWGCKR